MCCILYFFFLNVSLGMTLVWVQIWFNWETRVPSSFTDLNYHQKSSDNYKLYSSLHHESVIDRRTKHNLIFLSNKFVHAITLSLFLSLTYCHYMYQWYVTGIIKKKQFWLCYSVFKYEHDKLSITEFSFEYNTHVKGKLQWLQK